MIPPRPHDLLCLNNAVIRRTSGRSLEIFKESNLLRISANRQQKLSLVSNCTVMSQCKELSGYLLDTFSKNGF
jgi:hypothetical protein